MPSSSSSFLSQLLARAHWGTGVAAGLAFVAAMMIAAARRSRAARARVRAALAAGPAALADGAEVVLTGVLRAERPVVSVAAMGFGGGRELVEISPGGADDGWLELTSPDGPVRIELAAPVAVTVGSRVVRHFTLPTERFEAAAIARDRARRAMQLGMWRSGIDAYHVRHVAPGDEVVARGRLVRRPDGGWALDGRGGAGAIELASTRAVVDPPPLPPAGAMARAAIVAAGVFLLGVLVANA